MRFMVIEGLDGSGKSTQLKLMRSHLEKGSIPYRYLHFPRLETGVYGKLIARFLRGEMGAIDKVDPYLVALLFAGDRADAAGQVREWMDSGFLVIADRYVYSNIAFQCAKLSSRGEIERLRDWILDFEYNYQGLPRPDINLYLDVPFSFTRQQLVHHREGDDRDYLKGERDIHEEDLQFQERVGDIYHSLAGFVDDLEIVNCTDGHGAMLPPETVSEKIIKRINAIK